MTDYIAIWMENLLGQEARLFSTAPLQVTGERDRHLGPRWEYAKVTAHVESCSCLEVIDLVPKNDELELLGYPESFVLGVLDVLMVDEQGPIRGLRLTLKHVDFNSVDSSYSAFRMAGRDAGQKIVEALRVVVR